MTTAQQIREFRKELGVKDTKIPTSKSKQKNLLAHLHIKVTRKRAQQKDIDSGKAPTAPKRDTSNDTLNEEPRSRREFVKMVQSYRDSLRYELKDAIHAAATDLNCKVPSIQTYYYWEAAITKEDEEGNKVLTDTQANTLMNKKPKVKKQDQSTFVKLVYEHASSLGHSVEMAIEAVAEKLGVEAPGYSTVYYWKNQYRVDVPTLSKSLNKSTQKQKVVKPAIPVPPPTEEITVPIVETPKEEHPFVGLGAVMGVDVNIDYIIKFIESASREEVSKLNSALEARKLQIVDEIENEISRLQLEKERLLS